ncbi:toll/interleukin-1 receptor domain-containing protein [Vibrio fluvialis]|uniref:toll/interleukin-1 receptor domain-containing protein n=1 Tax=Vibrio fluvialis TaxID=676 RepID=UPI001558A3AB|nr:toll/interleukin-1 receptor domain-containing protein [Vibrio fluvialis]
MATPTVFISYSHDDQAHKKWVLDLATRLRNFGVDAILDQFRLGLGSELAGFMEQEVVGADRVIMVCTDKYVEKANAGQGGVGYEKMILTAEYMKKVDSTKIIPLIRQKGSRNVPTFLQTKLHIDFSKDDDYELMFDELVREIHGAPLFKEPPVGNNPFQTIEEKPVEKTNDTKLNILRLAVEAYEQGDKMTSHKAIYLTLGISRIIFEIHSQELIKEGFFEGSFFGSGFVTITDKAKIYAYQQGWLKG